MHTVHLSQQACRCSAKFTSPRSSTLSLVAGATRQQRQQYTAQTPAASAALLLAGAATTAQLLLPIPAPATPAAVVSTQPDAAAASTSAQSVVGDLSVATAPAIEAEADDILSEMTEDVALPPALMRFMELITNGPVKNADQLQDARRSVGFERLPDGRVVLLTEDGEPFQVKADMGVPGMLLLRDAGGYMYYLPRDDDVVLQQIDLSDDAVVAQLFANHAWEELVEPLEFVADDEQGTAAQQNQLQSSSSSSGKDSPDAPVGRLQQLRLTERQFRGVVSLIAGGQELPEEPLEQLDEQEQ